MKKDHAPGPSWLNPRDAGMLEAPTQATRQKKEIKGIKRGKKSNNFNLKMTWLDRKVPKTLPNTLETTVSTTWQDTELTCRYILFLWTDNKHKEKNHRHTLQHSQRKENLTKNVNDLHIESFKYLKKDIKKDTSKWKDIPYSRTGGINIVKLIIPPKPLAESMQS